MKTVFFITAILIAVAGCTNTNREDTSQVRIPGEFEPQNALWLGFNTVETEGYDSITIRMIRELNGSIKLNLIVEADSLLPEGKTLFAKMGLDTSMIHIVYQSPTDVWYRDPGPLFAITRDHKLAIADLKYTNYSNLPPDSISEKAKAHEGIDRDIAKRLGIPAITSRVAMEGGAFEPNGQGALIQVEKLTLRRNPHLTKADIEKDFRTNFGITDVIWLPSGVADDPHNFERIYQNIYGMATGGHTDEFVRFANDSTILCAWVNEEDTSSHPINRLNYAILKRNFDILQSHVRPDGTHFKVIKVPHPEPKTYRRIVKRERFGAKTMAKYDLKEGDSIAMAYASSYLNYLITDKVILLPEYWAPGQPSSVREKDEKVHRLFEKLYPARKIVGINPLALNMHGGGMHCRYQPEPRVE